MIALWKWYLTLLALLLVTLLLQISAKYQFLPLTNLYIPDSWVYEQRVLFDLTGNSFFSDGLTYYNRLLYAIGPASIFITNAFILFTSVYLCKVFECVSDKSVNLARFIIVFNPYLLVGAIGPNKETLLIFISLLSFTFFFKDSLTAKLLGIAIAILTLFVRPHAGIVIVGSMLLVPLIPLFRNPINLFLSILFTYFAFNAIPVFNEFFTASQGEDITPYFQTSSIFEVILVLIYMNEHPILQIPGFMIKVCLILITPIARPNPFFSQPFAILDAGYSLIAYYLLPFNLGLLLLIKNKSKVQWSTVSHNTQFLILFCLIGILSTLMSSIITFRYIFPYTPVIVSLFYLNTIKVRNQVITLSFLLITFIFVTTAIFMRRQFQLETGIDSVAQFMSWL
jgi:hypothetical protein